MEIIQSTGPSLVSLLRGVTGMLVFNFYCLFASNNRRAISWKTVGIGLFIQILIAAGVLKINFIKNIFEILGGFYKSPRIYRERDTKMLLGEFGNIETWIYFLFFRLYQ